MSQPALMVEHLVKERGGGGGLAQEAQEQTIYLCFPVIGRDGPRVPGLV